MEIPDHPRGLASRRSGMTHMEIPAVTPRVLVARRPKGLVALRAGMTAMQELGQ